MSRPILLCTVGTSLLSNLKFLKADERPALAAAHAAKDWPAVAAALAELPPNERVCGAEINSVASMVQHGYAAPTCGIYVFHSATSEGRDTATILTDYFHRRGHAPVTAVEVADLQDEIPRRFKTHGLRNLAKLLCARVRDHSAAACAVNATGGYKAQVAVAVLLGQALGIPVYYMHERFSEIIAFPPLPVALDFEVWMRASGMLFDLERATDVVPAADYAEDWSESYESLVERVTIDNTDYLELAATGQIFHETFRERFGSTRDQVLPPPAGPGQKQPPHVEDSGHMPAEVLPQLQALTNAVPFVTRCATWYCNPDLPQRSRFRLGAKGIDWVLSNGTWTVKARIDTTATTDGQRAAAVAALNEWLANRR